MSELSVTSETAESSAYVFDAVQTFEVQGDLAVARVVMYTEHGEPAYRQTRFYRRTGERWLPTAPNAALWGPERSLATPSFVYHFRQNDAQAVIAVAPQIEALYTTLWHNFGLPLTSRAEKLTIEVSVTQSPGHTRFQPHNDEGFVLQDRWVVAPPALYLAPVELTDADLLAQSIALPLIEQALTQAKGHHAIEERWQPLLDGLHLWQVWDLDLPLAAWRIDVVQWLYREVLTVGNGQTSVLPERYERLCATHKLWMPVPMQIEIPLWCSDLDRIMWHPHSWYLHKPPVRLAQLGIAVPPDEYFDAPRQRNHPAQTVALAMLVEYAAATYGRERLPALVTGLGQYESWETLIPAVFDVSTAEFEAGWQAYLAAKYGVQRSD